MRKFKRRQLFIDRKLQGALLFRAAGYWVYCLVAVALMMTCWIIFFDRPFSSGELFERLSLQLLPALLATILLVPIVIVDCMRLSNRFAGPLYRLRRAMHGLADGQKVQPIHFRDGDFLSDMADDFNRLIALVPPSMSSQKVDDSDTAGS